LQESDLPLACVYRRRCLSVIKSTTPNVLSVLLFQPEMPLGIQETGRDSSIPCTPLPIVDLGLLMAAVPGGHKG